MVSVCVGQKQSNCANLHYTLGLSMLLIQKLVHLGQSFQYTDEILKQQYVSEYEYKSYKSHFLSRNLLENLTCDF